MIFAVTNYYKKRFVNSLHGLVEHETGTRKWHMGKKKDTKQRCL